MRPAAQAEGMGADIRRNSTCGRSGTRTHPSGSRGHAHRCTTATGVTTATSSSGWCPLRAIRTLDIGCGEGRLSRDLRGLGHRVLGIDVSATMTAAARILDPSLPVVVADAAALPLPDETADLAIAFMSLQDVDDLYGSLRETARVLRPRGRLCMAIVHPLNSAGRFEGRDPDSPFVVTGSYLDNGYYLDEVERDGLPMRFASVHRPLHDYFAALSAAGLLVEELREPTVPDDSIWSPSDRRWQRVPLFLHLRAIRT